MTRRVWVAKKLIRKKAILRLLGPSSHLKSRTWSNLTTLQGPISSGTVNTFTRPGSLRTQFLGSWRKGSLWSWDPKHNKTSSLWTGAPSKLKKPRTCYQLSMWDCLPTRESSSVSSTASRTSLNINIIMTWNYSWTTGRNFLKFREWKFSLLEKCKFQK